MRIRFADIQHQPRALSILARALASGRTHHAYLFDGPEGVGREMTACALAARLMCLARDELREAGSAPASGLQTPVRAGQPADWEPCGACPSCRLLAADSHPDFHRIDRSLRKFHPDRAVRASKGLFLGIDLIRRFLIEPATVKPQIARRRVFVMREAERMNEDAQNALLKTLEEPPGDTTILLITQSSARLLATIRSRSQLVPFQALPDAFVAERLRAAGVAPDDAKALAWISGGRLGVALRWRQHGVLEALTQIAEGLDPRLFAAAEGWAKQMLDLAGQLATAACRAGDDATARQEGEDAAEDDGADQPETALDGRASAAREPAGRADDAPEPPGRAFSGREPAERGSGGAIATDELRDGLKLVLRLMAFVYREALLVRTDSADLCKLPAVADVARQLAAGAGDPAEDTHAIAECERMLDRNVQPQLACERLAVALLHEVPAM